MRILVLLGRVAVRVRVVAFHGRRRSDALRGEESRVRGAGSDRKRERKRKAKEEERERSLARTNGQSYIKCI